MLSIKLISFDLCPYVQRAAISLQEKGIPFERITIDLAKKPDWFTRISPLGKVPVLLVGDEPIFESTVILEYLEETQPHPLYPAEPLLRAQHRAWIEFGSSILADIWTIETTPDPVAFDAKRTLLAKKFARLEATLGAGPYFEGERFSLVDAVFAPVFRYFDVFERHADLGVLDDLTKVSAWREVLARRTSVRDAVVPDYPARLEAFLARQNGVFSRLMKQAA